MKNLIKAWRAATEGVESGTVLPTNQPQTTALAIELAWNLARMKKTKARLLTYAAPHKTATYAAMGNRFERLDANIEAEIGRAMTMARRRKDAEPHPIIHLEFMVDGLVVALGPRSDTKEHAIVALESEAASNHATGYALDRAHFTWDFCKLLHFSADNLLFVARVAKANTRMPQLKESLAQCANEYSATFGDRPLYVVLLPSAQGAGDLFSFGKWNSAGGRFDWEPKRTGPKNRSR